MGNDTLQEKSTGDSDVVTGVMSGSDPATVTDLSLKREEFLRKEVAYRVVDETKRLFGPDGLHSVVNIGGGFGSHNVLLSESYPSAKFVSVDLFRPNSESGGPTRFEVASAEGLTSVVPRESFDLALMIEVIEHVRDTDTAIRQVRESLRPGGHLILTTPNLSSLVNRVALLVGYMPLEAEVSNEAIFGRPGQVPVGHLRLFTYRSTLEFLRYHGFRIVRAYTIASSQNLFSGPNRRFMLVHFVDRFANLFSSRLGTRTIVVAQKPQSS